MTARVQPPKLSWYVVNAWWKVGGYQSPFDPAEEFLSLEDAMAFTARELCGEDQQELNWNVRLDAPSVVAYLTTCPPGLAQRVPVERWIYNRPPDGVLICRYPVRSERERGDAKLDDPLFPF